MRLGHYLDYRRVVYASNSVNDIGDVVAFDQHRQFCIFGSLGCLWFDLDSAKPDEGRNYWFDSP